MNGLSSASKARRNAATLLFSSALLGGVCVAMGAFGAHGLRHTLPESSVEILRGSSVQGLGVAVLLAAIGLIGFHTARMSVKVVVFLVAGSMAYCGSRFMAALAPSLWDGAIAALGLVILLIGLAMLVGEVAQSERKF